MSVISVHVIISNYILVFSCHINSYDNIFSYHFISSYSYIFISYPTILSHPLFASLLPSADQPEERVTGWKGHGRTRQVRFYPSKAMAEAMDAADMPGLHGKLLKLHRNLGHDFNIFSNG